MNDYRTTLKHRTRKVAHIDEEFQCECGWPVMVGDWAYILVDRDGYEAEAFCSSACRSRWQKAVL